MRAPSDTAYYLGNGLRGNTRVTPTVLTDEQNVDRSRPPVRAKHEPKTASGEWNKRFSNEWTQTEYKAWLLKVGRFTNHPNFGSSPSHPAPTGCVLTVFINTHVFARVANKSPNYSLPLDRPFDVFHAVRAPWSNFRPGRRGRCARCRNVWNALTRLRQFVAGGLMKYWGGTLHAGGIYRKIVYGGTWKLSGVLARLKNSERFLGVARMRGR